jgi:hypothetical protein
MFAVSHAKFEFLARAAHFFVNDGRFRAHVVALISRREVPCHEDVFALGAGAGLLLLVGHLRIHEELTNGFPRKQRLVLALR